MFVPIVGEELERRGFGIFLAHEQQRRLRCKQEQRGRSLDRAARHNVMQPLAKAAIPNLIMVLNAEDVSR